MAENEANNQSEELTGGLAGFKKISKSHSIRSAGDPFISVGNSETANAYISAGAIGLLGTAEAGQRFDYHCNRETKEIALVFSAEGDYVVSNSGVIAAGPLLRLGAVRGDILMAAKIPGDATVGLVFKLDNLKELEGKDE